MIAHYNIGWRGKRSSSIIVGSSSIIAGNSIGERDAIIYIAAVNAARTQHNTASRQDGKHNIMVCVSNIGTIIMVVMD